MQNPRLIRLRPVLACPACRGELAFESDHAHCAPCARSYPIRNGKIYFVDVPERSDSLDDLKGRLKRSLGVWYYRIGVTILGPTYPFSFGKMIRRHLDTSQQIVVDAGSGNHRIDDQIICVDLFDYDAVDVICDLSRLPFKAGSIDAFVTRSVLEHVADIAPVVQSFHECTRPGGWGIHLIPFLFPYHASPGDYQRYTHEGQARLFKDWYVTEQFNATGPATLFVLIMTELLSVLFSFGHRKLQAVLYLAACGIFCPVKFLDVLFARRQAFMSLAPSIVSVLRKPEAGVS
jgi:SAM-dependent methyltransferase